MSSRDLELLYVPFKNIIKEALKIAEERNLPVTITCTQRHPDEQKALFAQGRESLEKVNKKRRDVRLWDITEKENNKIVTWTLSSKHTILPLALAIDFAIGKKNITWDIKSDVNNNDIPDYQEFAEICKSIDPENIVWGGDWTKKDYCHIEWRSDVIQSNFTKNNNSIPNENIQEEKNKKIEEDNNPIPNENIQEDNKIGKEIKFPFLNIIRKLLIYKFGNS